MWWHWGQGAELAWVECTQPHIITDSKQLVLLGLFSPSDGERVHFGSKRKGSENEEEEGKDSLKTDKECHPCSGC